MRKPASGNSSLAGGGVTAAGAALALVAAESAGAGFFATGCAAAIKSGRSNWG